MAENIFGADLKPNGRRELKTTDPSHFIPRSSLSEGWIGTMRYAESMSNFASRAPGSMVHT